MDKQHFLAFDIGASSGRAILGILKNGHLELVEVHRFKNEMTQIDGSYFWDIQRLFGELKLGLKKCISDFQVQPDSVGVDTWGVDYSLVSASGELLSLPYAYRDHRTDNAMADFFEVISKKETYLLSGIQFLQFNTLFQLFVEAKNSPAKLAQADGLLFTPDMLNFLFCGVRKNEYTIASTSQMLVPGAAKWQNKLVAATGINPGILQEIVQPGTVLGNVLPEVKNETGSSDLKCVAVAGHDTASAIVSVPADGGNWAYLSSGTWSLLGVESPVPVVSEKSLEMNFTNEGGVDGTTRLLKNIMGMWLIQECKRAWDLETEFLWEEIVEMSQAAEPFKSLINVDEPMFLNPGDMPRAIQKYCQKTEQPVPGTKGEIARCVYDSLVLKYKYTIAQLESLTGKKIEKLHIIGGGAHNKMMNQLTANALGIPVFAGPTEATAIGNILLQAKALGQVGNLDEIRAVVCNSFEVTEYTPSPKLDWDTAFERFKDLNES